MIAAALGAMLLGVLCGQFWFPQTVSEWLSPGGSIALSVLVFSVGVEIGSDRELPHRVRSAGLSVLLLPVANLVGSLLGGIAVGLLCGLPFRLAGGVSSGFAWYSLSAVLLTESVSEQAGTLAFFVNLFREILAVALIPLCAKTLGPYAAIAPAGATSMDTTLSLLRRYTDESAAIAAIVNGVVCSTAVPVLVSLFCP